MSIIVVSANSGVNFTLPVIFLFWAAAAVYILHVFEESVLPEVFVDKVKRLYWEEYTWKRFFGFNTILISLNIISVLCYENLGNAWIIFPLSLAVERFFNGIYHLMETVITKKYSSGLLTSVIHWIICYMIIRYSLLKGEIRPEYFISSLIIGFVIAFLMIGSLFVKKIKNNV